MPTAKRLDPEDVHGDEQTAAAMFGTNTTDLNAMFGKGGNARVTAALEIGRRAFNKGLKKSNKAA